MGVIVKKKISKMWKHKKQRRNKNKTKHSHVTCEASFVPFRVLSLTLKLSDECIFYNMCGDAACGYGII